MEELWIRFLGLWMASGWLADGLAGAGWGLAGVWLGLAGRLAGHRDPQELRDQGRVMVNRLSREPRTTTFIKKPSNIPTPDQGHQTPETRTRD